MAPNRSIPCTLCARFLEQREDKNGKPYFVCNECGTQFFIRGTAGKERLAELMRRSKADRGGADTKGLIDDVETLQEFVEEFGADERIIPDDGLEKIVRLPDWSRAVCDNVIDELKRSAGRR